MIEFGMLKGEVQTKLNSTFDFDKKICNYSISKAIRFSLFSGLKNCFIIYKSLTIKKMW